MKIGTCKLSIKGVEVDLKFCIKSVMMQSQANPEFFKQVENEEKIEETNYTSSDVLDLIMNACFYAYLAACFYNRKEAEFDIVDFWEEYETNDIQFGPAFKCYLEATGVNENIPKDKNTVKKKSIMKNGNSSAAV